MEEELRTRCAASVVRVLGLSEWRFKKKKHFLLELHSSFAFEPTSPSQAGEGDNDNNRIDEALGKLELVLFQIKSHFFAIVERKKLKVPLRRRDGWPSAWKEFRRQIILLGFDAPFKIFPNYKFTIDSESVWKLLISEVMNKIHVNFNDIFVFLVVVAMVCFNI